MVTYNNACIRVPCYGAHVTGHAQWKAGTVNRCLCSQAVQVGGCAALWWWQTQTRITG